MTTPATDKELSYREITETVSSLAERREMPKAWYAALTFSLFLLSMFAYALYQLFSRGVGVWGNTNSVAWGFDIVNFVFWVGIAHAGTLISAVLFLFRQSWRTRATATGSGARWRPPVRRTACTSLGRPAR